MRRSSVQVAVCDGPPHLAGLFDALCTLLDERGVRYGRYPSPRAWFADAPALASTEVAIGFGDMPIDGAVLDRTPCLHAIVSCVSGTEGISLEEATARGVIVAHAPTGENVRSMAEAAMLLLLHLHYDLDNTRDDLRLNRPRPAPVRARLLAGRTIGLVGWGRIAHTLVELLQPWGVTRLVHSRRGRPDDLPAGVQAVPLDALFARSDAICVLAGAVAGAPPIVGSAQIAVMKPDACLINLSRGSTVDEAALTQALRERRIAGAALDVFAIEPLPADSPLRGLPNVVLTPHHVGHTREGDASLFTALNGNVSALLEGRPPLFVRNPDVLAAWAARRAAVSSELRISP
jgi:phosphoglycerate dehydrogenase-like enzyme